MAGVAAGSEVAVLNKDQADSSGIFRQSVERTYQSRTRY